MTYECSCSGLLQSFFSFLGIEDYQSLHWVESSSLLEDDLPRCIYRYRVKSRFSTNFLLNLLPLFLPPETFEVPGGVLTTADRALDFSLFCRIVGSCVVRVGTVIALDEVGTVSYSVSVVVTVETLRQVQSLFPSFSL